MTTRVSRRDFAKVAAGASIATFAGGCSNASQPPLQPAQTAGTFTSADPAARAVHRRAVEAVNWGLAAVNVDLMYQAGVRAKGATWNQIVYWSRLPDWKIQTLTPNPDSIYLKAFVNTKEAGPVVLEIPPADGGSITATIMDCWQAALEDVGPAGVDKGKGGKYVILPPGSTNSLSRDYIPVRSETYQAYSLLRSILKSTSDADVAKAVEYARRIKLYPQSQATNPPPTVFVDVVDVVFDATIPYDVRFFQSLDRIVQSQPWLERDKAMIDLLKSIGIEKGKTFDPNPDTQRILNDAAREAHEWLTARYERGFPPYYDGGHWGIPGLPELLKTMGTSWEAPNIYTVDSRGLMYSYAYASIKHQGAEGAGQFYLIAIRDRSGQLLDGGRSYRLTVPANAPITQYWSATVYDRATHALIREAPRPSRSSQSRGIQKNSDGSVDVYFGPKAPEGKDTNWVPTQGAAGFEVLFRLYGPEKAVFDKTWVLPDIEQVG